MPHAHLYINKPGEHLTDNTTYNKFNSDLTEAIRNNSLSALDFLHGACQVGQKTRDHLTHRAFHVLRSCTSPMYFL